MISVPEHDFSGQFNKLWESLAELFKRNKEKNSPECYTLFQLILQVEHFLQAGASIF